MDRRNFLKKSAAAIGGLMTGCHAGSPTSPSHEYSPDPYEPDYDALAGAGDIGCSPGAVLTAGLLQELKTGEPYTRIFTLGDNAQDQGTLDEYACFDRTWGPMVDYPVFGNHDSKYFFTYFNETGNGYYSKELRHWHLAFLNSEIDISKDSIQLAWLDYDLRNRNRKWIAAFSHRPRFSSGVLNGDTQYMSYAWDKLLSYGSKALSSGHDHHAEVFQRMNSSGKYDPNGMAQFVFGTGGADQTGYEFVKKPRPASIVRQEGVNGIVRMLFKEKSLEWNFIPVPGSDFTASGSIICE